ncbi:MAG: 16S rRNA (guanine(527)-N(7))-methyltransferase RsmG [Burkholderiaceae bacterium]
MIDGEVAAKAWLRGALGCDTVCMERLERFVGLLLEENTRQNLVAASSLAEVWTRHIADSAQLAALDPGVGPWLDLGTGAGFPGLIVSLLRPGQHILVESRARRADWLRRAAGALGAANATVVEARVERVAAFAAGTISGRAFAPLDRLLALAKPFSTRETRWLLPKGRNGFKELSAMPKTIRTMFHVEPSLTDCEAAILVGRGVPDVSPSRSVR